MKKMNEENKRISSENRQLQKEVENLRQQVASVAELSKTKDALQGRICSFHFLELDIGNVIESV